MLSMPRIVRPIRASLRLGGIWFPPLDRLLADPLNETKNSPNVHYYFPRLPKRKLRCSFTPNRAAPDEWDADFRQTKSKTRVPIRYAFSI